MLLRCIKLMSLIFQHRETTARRSWKLERLANGSLKKKSELIVLFYKIKNKQFALKIPLKHKQKASQMYLFQESRLLLALS